MIYTFSESDIQKGYEALTNYSSDNKLIVWGNPARKDFYYARLVLMLILQDKARGGDLSAQSILSAIPCAALQNNNAFPVDITYNSYVFSLPPGDIHCMRQNEVEFFVDKASEQRLTLTQVPMSDFYTSGKAAFFYW